MKIAFLLLLSLNTQQVASINFSALLLPWVSNNDITILSKEGKHSHILNIGGVLYNSHTLDYRQALTHYGLSRALSSDSHGILSYRLLFNKTNVLGLYQIEYQNDFSIFIEPVYVYFGIVDVLLGLAQLAKQGIGTILTKKSIFINKKSFKIKILPQDTFDQVKDCFLSEEEGTHNNGSIYEYPFQAVSDSIINTLLSICGVILPSKSSSSAKCPAFPELEKLINERISFINKSYKNFKQGEEYAILAFDVLSLSKTFFEGNYINSAQIINQWNERHQILQHLISSSQVKQKVTTLGKIAYDIIAMWTFFYNELKATDLIIPKSPIVQENSEDKSGKKKSTFFPTNTTSTSNGGPNGGADDSKEYSRWAMQVLSRLLCNVAIEYSQNYRSIGDEAILWNSNEEENNQGESIDSFTSLDTSILRNAVGGINGHGIGIPGEHLISIAQNDNKRLQSDYWSYLKEVLHKFQNDHEGVCGETESLGPMVNEKIEYIMKIMENQVRCMLHFEDVSLSCQEKRYSTTSRAILLHNFKTLVSHAPPFYPLFTLLDIKKNTVVSSRNQIYSLHSIHNTVVNSSRGMRFIAKHKRERNRKKMPVELLTSIFYETMRLLRVDLLNHTLDNVVSKPESLDPPSAEPKTFDPVRQGDDLLRAHKEFYHSLNFSSAQILGHMNFLSNNKFYNTNGNGHFSSPKQDHFWHQMARAATMKLSGDIQVLHSLISSFTKKPFTYTTFNSVPIDNSPMAIGIITTPDSPFSVDIKSSMDLTSYSNYMGESNAIVNTSTKNNNHPLSYLDYIRLYNDNHFMKEQAQYPKFELKRKVVTLLFTALLIIQTLTVQYQVTSLIYGWINETNSVANIEKNELMIPFSTRKVEAEVEVFDNLLLSIVRLISKNNIFAIENYCKLDNRINISHSVENAECMSFTSKFAANMIELKNSMARVSDLITQYKSMELGSIIVNPHIPLNFTTRIEFYLLSKDRTLAKKKKLQSIYSRTDQMDAMLMENVNFHPHHSQFAHKTIFSGAMKFPPPLSKKTGLINQNDGLDNAPERFPMSKHLSRKRNPSEAGTMDALRSNEPSHDVNVDGPPSVSECRASTITTREKSNLFTFKRSSEKRNTLVVRKSGVSEKNPVTAMHVKYEPVADIQMFSKYHEKNFYSRNLLSDYASKSQIGSKNTVANATEIEKPERTEEHPSLPSLSQAHKGTINPNILIHGEKSRTKIINAHIANDNRVTSQDISAVNTPGNNGIRCIQVKESGIRSWRDLLDCNDSISLSNPNAVIKENTMLVNDIFERYSNGENSAWRNADEDALVGFPGSVSSIGFSLLDLGKSKIEGLIDPSKHSNALNKQPNIVSLYNSAHKLLSHMHRQTKKTVQLIEDFVYILESFMYQKSKMTQQLVVLSNYESS